jgi:hypothetical protein
MNIAAANYFSLNRNDCETARHWCGAWLKLYTPMPTYQLAHLGG